MTGAQGDGRAASYEAEVVRLVVARAPAGLLFFLACVGVSAVFDVVRFPERAQWMIPLALGFAVLAAATHVLIGKRPAWSVHALIAFVNVVGVALNGYHALVGASVAMCLWTLTGLLASAAVILPWSARNQALASLGAVLAYPVHLEAGLVDMLSWSAGGTYLLIVVAMSVFGAGLFASYVRDDLVLTRTLSEREAQLQSYFDLGLIGTAILSADGTFREVNDELCRILGYGRSELLGMRWGQLVAPGERDAGATRLARALQGAETQPGETRLVRKDGALLHASVGMRGLPGPAGALDHVIAVVQDVTDRKRIEAEREAVLARELGARQEAEAASRAKDAFLATVSHELRTPLSPILAWSDLLRRKRLDAEQTENALAAIERNAGVQAQLIADLLDVSRIVSGKLRLDRRLVELAPVIREAVEVVRPAAESKGVALETALDPDAGCVWSDADRLRQVFWNLLSNAVKFTPAGGRVQVRLARTGTCARIAVADTGRGIGRDFLAHVFERFRQADVTPARVYGGLGIGLAIVRELVDLHGGSVRAESPGEGRGATFTVELPLAPGVPVAAEKPRATDYAPLDGLRVLVVDDDPDSNEVVRTVLASCGAEVRTATSVGEALSLLARWRPDVLVSDLCMPGDDGYALIARLRAQDSRYPRLPAIALTAYASPADRDQALSAGFQAHVGKPLRSVELVSAVRAAVEAGAPG